MRTQGHDSRANDGTRQRSGGAGTRARKDGAPRVILVGRRLSSNENLGLCYLRAALRHAGITAETHYVSNTEELTRAANAILDAQPSVLGFSLADGGSSFLALTLGELVRRRGFRGHITCGGQFATLARDWLLARYPAIDSVVRHDGELPLVELVHAVERGESVNGLASLTTREGDGPPAHVLDDTPMTLWPDHDELPQLIGYPAAHVVGSRGCWGRCHYCGPAALSTLSRNEGRARGLGVQVLNQSGVGGLRRRDFANLAGEMAHLYRDRGVRYFYFVDEHFLPQGETAALEYLARFKDALDVHKLGPFGIGCMLRANWISPAVVRAFREVGLVRCFVGLEVATKDEGRMYGRRAPGDEEIELLRTFRDLDIATVSNLMMLHPDSTPDLVRAGTDLLSRVPAGVFEATRMQVYHGTKLHDRIAEEGRLIGNPLRYGYTFPDPAMERFAEIFTRLRGEAFWNYSIAYRTHDAHLALALALRVCPERVKPNVQELVEETRHAVNMLYVEGYRRGLELALEGGGFAEADPLIREIRGRADSLDDKLARLEDALLRLDVRHDRSFAPMRAAAATMMTFALMSGGAGCYRSHTIDDGGARVDGGRPDGGRRDASMCSDARSAAELAEVPEIARDADECFAGSVFYPEAGADPNVNFGASSGGFPTLGGCRDDEATLRAQEEMAERVRAALEARGLECAQGLVHVAGGTQTDLQSMSDRINDCNPLFDFSDQVRIILDEAGAVVDVRVDPPRPELQMCLQAALTGLTFPCLASFEVCPEFAIAE
jgi:anaerobic magnesium-protoporphyrin IX monomethyl ester cyclase